MDVQVPDKHSNIMYFMIRMMDFVFWVVMRIGKEKFMRKKRLRFLSVMLATVLAFPSTNMTALAEKPDVGAESQEVVSVGHEVVTDVEGEEHILNYRDIPGDDQVESISEYGDDYIPANRTDGEEIPKAWKGENVSAYMPPLRNQSPFGSCWAHAALALAEISLRKKGKLTDSNLSEVQLAYFSYYWKEDPLGGTAGDKNEGVFGDYNYLDLGGSLALAQNVLASWTGAAGDAGELAYPSRKEDLKETLDDRYAYDDIAHLQNYYNVSIDPKDGITSPDMQAAKKLIKENGALGISFFAESSRSNAITGNIYNETTNAYYDSDDHGNSTSCKDSLCI